MTNRKMLKNNTILILKLSTEKWVLLHDLSLNVAVFSTKSK